MLAQAETVRPIYTDHVLAARGIAPVVSKLYLVRTPGYNPSGICDFGVCILGVPGASGFSAAVAQKVIRTLWRPGCFCVLVLVERIDALSFSRAREFLCAFPVDDCCVHLRMGHTYCVPRGCRRECANEAPGLHDLFFIGSGDSVGILLLHGQLGQEDWKSEQSKIQVLMRWPSALSVGAIHTSA